MDFKYKVSVIVPVYNVEEFLPRCLDSLVNQTIDKSEMEILLINDGSPDNSIDICNDYAAKYPCIKVFSKENEGLSATRNYGIVRAQGKYLMFIDSDDYLSLDTVKGVTDFFDTVYDEVDLVTYYEQPFRNGRNLKSHLRFKYYLKREGVYDLEEFPYILQMRINVCVKNLGADNHLFDTTPNFRQEDQEYNNRVLMRKMKIGYAKTGCYYYAKDNENSIVATKFNAINLFEPSMAYLERLLNYFPDKVPPYFQAIVFHDLRWKFESRILLPHHYEGMEYDMAVTRIRELLKRIDNDIIINYPDLKEYLKDFWLSQKENANIIPYVRSTRLMFLADGKPFYSRGKMGIKIVRFQALDNGNVLVRGYVDSVFYNFVKEKPELYVEENGTLNKQLDCRLSVYGVLVRYVQVVNLYAFEYDLNPQQVQRFRLYVKVDGFEIETAYSYKLMAAINPSQNITELVCGNTLISYVDPVFHVKQLNAKQIEEMETEQTNIFFKEDIAQLRLDAIQYRKQHRIWLYSDLYTVEKDNGYYQFINDFGKNDGVERYYVYTRPYEEIEHLFTEEQKPYLVEYRSEQHKLLYLSAEIIFSAFYGRNPISPFRTEKDETDFYNIEHFRVIYLQHGVLHASLRVQNSAENARADKIVISSDFERQNLTENYHYREDALIPSSMARYDHIDRTAKPKGKILFAPSWRNYFAESTSAAKWETNLAAVQKSDYFINMVAFLESKTLADALEKNNITLEVKLHPIIADAAAQLFDFKTDRIVMADKTVEVTDYDMFITDFSSFVFDYACLSRPILYFVPDYVQFKAGMGHYKDLDLPFDKAFGPFTTNPEEAAALVADEIEKGFAVEAVYKERMDNFYLPLDRCGDRLYDYINEHMLPQIRKEKM